MTNKTKNKGESTWTGCLGCLIEVVIVVLIVSGLTALIIWVYNSIPDFSAPTWVKPYHIGLVLLGVAAFLGGVGQIFAKYNQKNTEKGFTIAASGFLGMAVIIFIK